MTRGRRPAAGFTLLEVLVAVAIVAVALAAGSRAASSVVDTSGRLTDVTLAEWCADNELTELRITDSFPNIGDTPFACNELGRSFKGTLRAQTTPNPSFRRVDTIVADADGHPLLTISTVVSR
ncbi:MAG TPA: type II secretion system minor pseudopilin GspI [Burkholderiaceae bacterium]